ncbi:MAG: hypothetical protein RIQ99_1016 [Pseudomonadota bacterium]
MLYLIAHYFHFEGLANLIRYQTFRAGAALMTALVIGLVIGPRFINMLRVRQGKGQPIREDGPKTHLAKRGTPTMGGLMILISLVVAMLLWMDLSNPFVWACLAVTGGFGLIGFLDDYDKVKKRSTAGVSGRVRLLAEFAVAGVAAWIIVSQISTNLYVPFLSGRYIPLGPLYYVFAAVVMVGAGNAVNLTDGLDGLATMPVVIAAGAFAIISYLAGRACARRSWGRALPSCGSTRRLRQCLWAIPAALRWAGRWARSRWRRITKLCWASLAGCSCSKRSR